MPRLFVALPVPEEIADDLLALQSGVPDARWIAPENFHVTLCFAGEVHGAMMRDFEEELSDIASPRFAVALAGVEQFSSGKQPRALVATVERSDRLPVGVGHAALQGREFQGDVLRDGQGDEQTRHGHPGS